MDSAPYLDQLVDQEHTHGAGSTGPTTGGAGAGVSLTLLGTLPVPYGPGNILSDSKASPTLGLGNLSDHYVVCVDVYRYRTPVGVHSYCNPAG